MNDATVVDRNSRCLPRCRDVVTTVASYFARSTSQPLEAPPRPDMSAPTGPRTGIRQQRNLPPLTLEVDTLPKYLPSDYQVVAECGYGAHSRIYHCRRDDQEVAVKVQTHRYFIAEEVDTLRTLKEVRGVVPLLDRMTDPQKVYLVMPFYRRGDLLEAINRYEYTTVNACNQLLLDIVELVQIVHRHGFVHLDLKFENIMLQDDGSLVLVDFGYAHTPVVGIARISCGTVPYSAPELSRRVYSPASDVYSLGMMIKKLYEVNYWPHPEVADLMTTWRPSDRLLLCEVNRILKVISICTPISCAFFSSSVFMSAGCQLH